jgi:predicted GNAT superfamily acetyltransferase
VGLRRQDRTGVSHCTPPFAAEVTAQEVRIRSVRTHEEFAACEAMSRDIWGAAERNVVPRELLLTMQINGGVVLGAFADDRMVGFVFGFAGVRDGRLRICSHQLGVMPEYRDRGIGIALKQAQREEARRLGYELITWTFDPLEARNAYINLHRLGCIARVYDRDHYGPMEDELNRDLPSDRFEAEWWLTSGSAPGGHRADRNTPGDAAVLLDADHDGAPLRAAFDLGGSRHARIRVPADFQAIKQRDMKLARHWRLESRAAFEAALTQGFVATDCTREGWYVMERVENPERRPGQVAGVAPGAPGEAGRRP